MTTNVQKVIHSIRQNGVLSTGKKSLAYLAGGQIKTRTDLLNYLIERFSYRDYLEIGVRDPRDNFDKVCSTGVAHGCDPAPLRPVSHTMTSDAFFAERAVTGGAPYDLIFIDGLHLAEQVERDVENALAHLTPNGSIVLHDCNPETEAAQVEEFQPGVAWNGTVWKAWVKLRATRPDLAMWVVDIDYGCGVIRRGSQATIDLPSLEFGDLDYAYLTRERKAALNLVSVAEFRRALRGRVGVRRRSLFGVRLG